MKELKLILIALVFALPKLAFAQPVVMTNGTVNVCGGTLYDDGGEAGAPYSATDYTMTLCPSNPGDVIQLTFTAFALQTNVNPNNSDYITFYDGNSTAAPSLGSYTGNSLQGYQVTGTVNNATGCLTIVFSDNGPANTSAATPAPGFEAEIICTTPCANPTSNISIVGMNVANPAAPSVSICIGESLTFSGQGSAPQPGFQITDYIWNFDDGAPIVNQAVPGVNTESHTFTEPGEYIVSLVVQDDNGCQSLNLLPVQVLVSTIPLFTGLEDQIGTGVTCFGELITLEGTYESVTWTALPPQVVAGETYLADGAGFSYSSSLDFDFFEAGATLTDCADLQSIYVNMEHSYMGDLGLTISCPNGTVVDLVLWGTNGGGGTFLGQALDDASNTPGVGWDYYWAPDATNGTWGASVTAGLTTAVTTPTNGTALSPGTYAAQGNLCDLVGCPLNGSWTFSVTDNLAIDNGYIFEWGLNLNPELYPGITTFTPSIGAASDSSYWELDPQMILVDGNTNSDVMQIVPPGPGTYDFTYHVINSFGCEYDTTIQITFEEPLAVTAPADMTYACGDLVLQGWFDGLPTPSCADCGVFNHCYNNGENFTWTFCPDNPGDGTTLSFEFISGQMEGFWEDFIIYDGNSTAAPIIATWSTGDATGQIWSATNPDGCITVSFSADGSVSCATGNYTPWEYAVSPGGPAYTWEWSPTTPVNFFNDPSLQAPTISNLTQTTTFTVTGYPVGHPGCASSDEVTVFIDPLGDPGLDADLTVCNNDPAFDLFAELGGNPVTTGTWTDPNGNPLPPNPQYDPATSTPGDYTYTVALGACNAFATVSVGMNLPYEMTISNDTSICYMGQLNMELLTQQNGNTPFNYSWDYNGTVVSNAMTYTGLFPTQDGTACLTVTDACNSTLTQCFNVEVKTLVPVTMSAEPPTACWPETMSVEITTDPTLYTQSTINISDGFTVSNLDSVARNFAEPGIYDVSLTLIDDIGCVYDTTIFGFLTSYDPPVAGWLADPQPADAENTTIQFTDMSEGNIVQYYWEFDTLNHAGYSEEVNPTYTFPPGIGGDYIVSQIVIDTNGCMDYAFGNIHINELFTLFIPNCFTPNGDNINDAMGFVGTDLDEDFFEFTVFNRWGYPVFHTTDPSEHWQGESDDGEYYVPNGIYMWSAKIRSKSTGEKKELTGSITMAR